MAWEDFKFTPEDGLENTTTFPSKPGSGAAARAQFMTILNQIKAFLNGGVKDYVDEHKADNVTDVDGAHGLKIEVGTFTPELKFGGNNVGLTYIVQLGYFVRIGDFVHVECSIFLSNKGSSVGDARVSGFPFASLTTNPGAILGPVRADYMNLPVNMVNLTFALLGADGLLIASINNANRTLLNDTHFSNNTLINLNGDYRR